MTTPKALPDATTATPLSGRAKALLRGLVLRPAIVLVLAFLGAPLALAGFAETATGEDDEEAEGRDYAELPGFPDSFAALGKFPKRFEAFFDDQFPLRLWLVKLSASVRFHIFRVSPNPAVVIGQDGWFYEGIGKERVQGSIVRERNPLADHLGQLRYTDAELAAWARVLEERRVVLAARGSRYVFALAPSKRMIYPEHLPEVLKRLKQETRLEQLSRHLAARSRVPFVDLTAALLAAKREPDRPLLFYKTDGHWNYYGAFVAYRALVNETNRAYSNVLGPPLALDAFDLEYDSGWSHPRFTAQMGVRVKEPYVRLLAREDNPLAELYFERRPFRQVSKKRAGDDALSFAREGIGGIVDFPRRSFDGASARYVKGAGGPEAPRLFVLGDSFVEKAYYLFAANAREVFGYREVLGFPDRLLEKVAPELVIHVIVQAFVLGEVPRNPDSLTQEYLAIASARADRSLFEGGERLKRHGDGRSSLTIPPLEASGATPVVVAVRSGAPARVRFENARGRKARSTKVEPGITRYLELDAGDGRAGGTLVFEGTGGELENVAVTIRQPGALD